MHVMSVTACIHAAMMLREHPFGPMTHPSERMEVPGAGMIQAIAELNSWLWNI